MKEVGILLKVAQTGLENLQKLTDGLSSAGIETKALDGKAAELSAELKRLAEEQALIDAFKRQKTATADAAKAMEAAKAAAGALGRELSTVEAPTKAQTTAFEKAKAAARAADEAYGQQRLALQQLRPQMAAAGVSADALASAQTRINRESAALRGEIEATTGWAQRMATAEGQAAQQATATANASRQAAAGIREEGAAAQQATSELDKVAAAARGLAGIGITGILGSQTAQLLKGVTETADQFANLQSRIKLVTGEGAAFTSAMEGIARVAQSTSSNLETTGNLFSKLAAAGKEMGIGQEAALRLTETVNQAVQLSGASAQSSDAAITQLVQALQSGVLRGDEFNSVMEQAPRLAKALADGLGVTTGQLRKMAEAGELSAGTVIKALQDQGATLRTEFDSLPLTVGRALENLRTKWTLFVGDLDKGSNATGVVAAGINSIANNLEGLAGMAERAGSVLLGALALQGVSALRALAAQAIDAGGAVGLLTKTLDEVPKVVNIAIVVTGLEIGYQFGTWLTEHSESARRLGINMVQFWESILNGLQLVYESAKAFFTSDTIEAAVRRYEERAIRMREILAGMREDAKQGPQEIKAEAERSKKATEELGASGKKAGQEVAGGAAAGAQALGGMGGAAAGAGAAVAAAGAAGAKAAGLASDAFGELSGVLSQVAPKFKATADEQAAAIAKLIGGGAQAAQMYSETLPNAIDNLSGRELERFRLNMVRAFGESEEASRKLAAQLAADGKDNRAALAQADRQAFLLKTTLAEVGKQAAQSLGVDVEAASTKVGAGFADALQRLDSLVKALPGLKAAGVDTGAVVGEALSKMIDGAKNQAELDAITAKVQALGDAQVISSAAVGGAMEQAADKAKDLKAKIEANIPGVQSLGEAARKAGVDVDVLTTGISDGFKKSVADVGDLVNQMAKAGTAAERTSPVLAEAFNKRLQVAQTKEEVQLLIKEIMGANSVGKIFGTDFTSAMDAAKRKLEELSPAVRQAVADARLLGVELKDRIGQGAEQGVEAGLKAYERLKAGGKASADEQAQAFVTLANKAIAAAQGQVPEWVRVEAAVRGVSIQVDATGKAVAVMAQGALANIQSVIAGFDLWATRQAERNAAVKSIYDPSGGRYDKEGFALNTAGQRLQASAQLKPPDDSGDWVFDAEGYQKAANAASRWGVGAPSGEYIASQFWVRKASAAGAVLAGSAAFAARSAAGSSSGGSMSTPTIVSAPTTQASAVATGSVRTFNINMGGMRSTVSTSDEASSTNLERILSALETASRSAA